MQITRQQKQLLRETFAQVQSHSAIAGLLFYRRLFTLEPSLKPLFRSDIEAQGRKLFEALEFAIASLESPQTHTAVLETLGRRHVAYGVRDEHYDTVGAALLWTLEQDLGPAFTPEVKAAWVAIYGFMAGTMKRAASEMSAVPMQPRPQSMSR
jgi:hemoglobin-like flavoprotein